MGIADNDRGQATTMGSCWGIIEDQLMGGEEIKMLKGQAARRTALSTLG